MDAPTTLTDLIEALAALPDLDPVERARLCPVLIEATKKVMKATRESAILEATDPPHRLSGVEVARALGIHPNKISEARRSALAEQGGDGGAGVGSSTRRS